MNVITLDFSTDDNPITTLVIAVAVTLGVVTGFIDNLSIVMAIFGGGISNRLRVSLFEWQLSKPIVAAFSGILFGAIGLGLESLLGL